MAAIESQAEYLHNIATKITSMLFHILLVYQQLFCCNLSPAAEDILVSAVISGRHHLTMSPWTSGYRYFSHVKKF